MSRRTPKLPSWLPVDPYIAVLLAHRRPRGPAARPGAAATGRGRRLDRRRRACSSSCTAPGCRPARRWTGSRHWRLHLTVIVASTFVLFPLLGLAARGLVPYVLTPQLYTGLLFLCLLPSTIQSSIAFTSIARGNVPAAICAGTFSSLIGILVTPLLAALPARLHRRRLLRATGWSTSCCSSSRRSWPGQLLRRWIGRFVIRHKKVLGAGRPRLDPAGRLHRVQRGHGARHLAPGDARSGCWRCSASRRCCWP